MVELKRFRRVGRASPGTNLVRIPFQIVGAAVAMLAVTLILDGILGDRPVLPMPYWLTVGSLDDAQSLLSATLGCASTVLALIFSVSLLVFSTVASQFGPRLMPYFLRDRTMQVTLGLFLASFVHSLITFVVAGQRGDATFVPQITVLSGVALIVASFGYLVIYNNRVAQAIQTNNVLPHIVETLHAAIAEFSQARMTDGAGDTPEVLRARCLAEGRPVSADTSGYVQRINHDRLVRAAARCEAVVCMAFRPGQFVLEGEALAHVLASDHDADLTAAVRGAVLIGQHRTLEQDIEFAFAQLAEIAIRALSPAVNDTYTGLICIDWLGDALRMLVALPAQDGASRTAAGEVRLLIPPLRMADIVPAAVDLIRQAGANSPAITIRLLQTYARLAPQLRNEQQRRAILEQVEALRESMARIQAVGLDQAALDAAYRVAHERLTGV
jgi:uncharacterized membrane protein